MKGRLRTLALVALFVALWTAPRWLWRAAPARRLDLTVVDKTVPFRRYREHEGLTWLLRAMKVTMVDGRFAEAPTHYVGYDPVARVGHDLGPEHLRHQGVLFIADTYGVYRGDYEQPGDVAALERSPRIYGGMTERELAAVEGFAARGGTVIAEFNTFASPTEDAPRARAERLFGVRWTRWVARYWPDLQDHAEVPRWVARVYERIYDRPFIFRGPGMVFVRDDADMLVLQPGVELEEGVIRQERTATAFEGMDDLPSRGGYRYWMDVVAPTDADVAYEHHVLATARGEELMRAHGLPSRFPAVTRRRGRADVWYMAGDFVDSGVDRGVAERAFILPWRRVTNRIAPRDADEASFWTWYAPLLRALIARRATGAGWF